MNDQARRDLLRILASAVILPTLTDAELGFEDHVGLPNLSDNDPLWVALYCASKADDGEAAVECLDHAISMLSSSSLRYEDALCYVYRATQGYYDEQLLEQKAGYVWASHVPR